MKSAIKIYDMRHPRLWTNCSLLIPRYGGDEFCVVLSGSTSEYAEKFCQRLTDRFSKEYKDITLSIGIAQTGPEHFDNHDTLIRRADSSMYEAKKSVAGFKS